MVKSHRSGLRRTSNVCPVRNEGEKTHQRAADADKSERHKCEGPEYSLCQRMPLEHVHAHGCAVQRTIEAPVPPTRDEQAIRNTITLAPLDQLLPVLLEEGIQGGAVLRIQPDNNLPQLG